MDLGLRGKRALVLAASKGLGRAAAEGLAAEGVDLVISSSDPQRCVDTANAIARAHDAKVVPVVADMFIPQSMDDLFARAVDILGAVDILFLNHPGPALGLAADIDTGVLEKQFRMMVVTH